MIQYFPYINGCISTSTSIFSNLVFEKDLIYFDGPLLSHFTNQTGENYLLYWLDCEHQASLWLLIQTEKLELLKYYKKTVNLKQVLFTTEKPCFYIIKQGSEMVEYIGSTSMIPEILMPEEDSYFDESLLHLSDQGSVPYYININDSWSTSELGSFMKVYSTVYYFLCSIRSNMSNTLGDLHQKIYTLQYWRSGSSNANFFRQIYDAMAILKPIDIESMQYASPGWLELNLDQKIASQISKSFNFADTEKLKIAENSIRSEMQRFDLTGDIDKKIRDLQQINTSIQLPQHLTSKKNFLDHHEIFIVKSTNIIVESMGMPIEIIDMTNKIAENKLITLKIFLTLSQKVSEIVSFRNRNMIEL